MIMNRILFFSVPQMLLIYFYHLWGHLHAGFCVDGDHLYFLSVHWKDGWLFDYGAINFFVFFWVSVERLQYSIHNSYIIPDGSGVWNFSFPYHYFFILSPNFTITFCGWVAFLLPNLDPHSSEFPFRKIHNTLPSYLPWGCMPIFHPSSFLDARIQCMETSTFRWWRLFFCEFFHLTPLSEVRIYFFTRLLANLSHWSSSPNPPQSALSAFGSGKFRTHHQNGNKCKEDVLFFLAHSGQCSRK